MNGASAALMVSDIPFPEPVGAVRIGKVDGNFVVNPTEEDLHEGRSDLDLVVSGTAEAILMVEAGATEIPEAEILDALDIAHDAIKKLVAAMNELGEKAGKSPKIEVTAPTVPTGPASTRSRASSAASSTRPRRCSTSSSARTPPRRSATRSSPASRPRTAPTTTPRPRSNASVAFDKLEKAIIRERIAVQKKRPDGRDTTEIRPISVEAGLLPRTHGSALFTRGQTQALSVVALGTSRENMRLDTLGLETEKWYFHHYNFPPFSVGEAGFMRGPKRRDIGHGALAERALVPMIPTQEDFPYTIRVVSDILESNGSSSMASVCGSTLSLMDAGVPIKAPVAGIAMGLIKEGDDYVVLTDIAGVEDHLGDMDFKVAGTEEGITALQMDIKITGVTFEILRDALTQAKEARLFILGEMAKVIDAPREQMSDYAPRISSIKIDPDKIGLLIGKGGETIRSLQEEFEAQIDVDDTGQVRVYAATGAQGDALVDRIRVDDQGGRDRRHVPGQGRQDHAVRRVHRARQGHRRPAAHLQRRRRASAPATVEEVLEKGQELEVRVVEVDRERGRIGLRLADDPEVAGKDASELAGVGSGDRGPRGGGGGDRGPRREGRGGDAAAAAAAATAAAAGATATAAATAARVATTTRTALPDHHRLTELDSGLRVITERMDGVRSAALGFFVANGSRGETRRGGRAVALPRAPAVQGHRPLRLGRDRPDVRRLGRRAQRRHGQGVHDGLRADARHAPATTPSR